MDILDASDQPEVTAYLRGNQAMAHHFSEGKGELMTTPCSREEALQLFMDHPARRGSPPSYMNFWSPYPPCVL